MPLELSSLCVLDAAGKVIRGVKVASEPEAPVTFLPELGMTNARVGGQAGPLSQGLYDWLQKTDFEAVLLETGHVVDFLGRLVLEVWLSDEHRGIMLVGWLCRFRGCSI